MFEIGDVADYMYVILKGRVVISNTHSFYKDINRILSTLKDGEEFGHMVLNESENSIADHHETEHEYAMRMKRQVMAKTVEVSRMLRINISDAKSLL